jgi:hypothetical protein
MDENKLIYITSAMNFIKHIFKTILILSSLNAASQVQLPLDSIKFNAPSIPIKYYVDINNEMDFFIGTWVYTEGSTTVKIEFKKELRVDWNGHFTDLLVGEYQYIENGVEKINTLNLINSRNDIDHAIYGRIRITKCNWFPTSECQNGQLKFNLQLLDPNNDNVSATLVIHQAYIDINDRRDAIIAYIIFKGPPTLNIDLGETFEPPTMPWQKEYRMLRQ